MNLLLVFLAGLLLAVSVRARPLLPDPPIGTGSGAFAGGGAAYAGGVDALFANPAALSIAEGAQLEAGMLGLANGASPYVLIGARAGEKTSYATGYYFDGREPNDTLRVPARQGLVAGASWDVGSAALGVAVRCVGTGEGIGLDGFGVDADAGALYRSADWVDFGVAIKNLQEAGVGQKPAGYETRRCYSLGTELHRSNISLGLFRMRSPSLGYEFRTAGTPPSDFTHLFSLGADFTPGGKLGLRSTFRLSQEGTPGFAIGMTLDLPVKQWGFLCGYVYDSGGKDGIAGESAPSHSISISLKWGGQGDKTPPKVWIRADRTTFDPRDASESGQVHFSLFAGDVAASINEGEDKTGEQNGADADTFGGNGHIRDWTLEIHATLADGNLGPVVRAFHGKDLPPRMVRWDGKDESGAVLPAGFYAFHLAASDLAGNQNVTVEQLLEIK